MSEIDKLRNRDRAFLEKLYHDYRKGFVLFASRYPLDQEEVLDIYQDAFVALIENAGKGLLDHIRSDLKTYLFSIGKFMIFKRLKQLDAARDLAGDPDFIASRMETEPPGEQVLRLTAALNQLGTQCYKILMLFYYEGKKYDELLGLTGYESRDVLKSQKSRCIKKLKEIMSKNDGRAD